MNILSKSHVIAFLVFWFFCSFGQDSNVNQPKKQPLVNIHSPQKKLMTTHNGDTVIVSPAYSTGAIVNPGKGWVLYGSAESQPKEILELASIGYTRYAWGDLEPKEGVYNWSKIDKDIKSWSDRGGKYAFGIRCASSTSSDFWISPKWVFDAGAKYSTFDLKDPKLPTEGSKGIKLVPVFDDPIFMAKLKNFIYAMGKRYDGNPNIAFIDIRSYGNWGEGHMHPFNKPDISPEKYQEHIQIHLNAFHKTLLQLPTGNKSNFDSVYAWALSQGIGFRRDGICGNSDGCEVTVCDGKMPSVFEFYGRYEMMESLGWWYGKKDEEGRGFTLESCIEIGKPSYCDLSRGGESGLNLLRKEPELIKKLTNRLGYHFVFNEVRYPKMLQAGKAATITITWENRGAAFIFVPAKVSYALVSSNGKIVRICDANNSKPALWKSDIPVTVTDIIEYADIRADNYTLAVGIRQPGDGFKPSIKIGVELNSIDNWYILGKIQIK